MSGIQRRQMLGWMGTAAAGAAVLSLEGCATSKLYEPRTYVETFSAMYITQDQRQIVILGPRYHYVFEAPTELTRLVQSDLHPDLQASFEGFEVAGDQTISGRYGLRLHMRKGSETPQRAAMAQSMGMAPRLRGEWTLDGTLKGRRYAAGESMRVNEAMTPLNRSYSVKVGEQPSAAEAVVKMALTPVTVAADGALMLASLVLLPFIVVLVAHDMHSAK